MLKNLVTLDVVERLGERLKQDAWYVDAVTGKYSCKGRVFHNPDKPWIYVNPAIGVGCSVYQAIVDHCKFIPSPCLACWKVVVKPNSLYELMRLYEFQREFSADRMGTGHFCKCGIETRPYVPQSYGGYFYCQSLEHGLHRYQQVRAAVDKINPNIPVVLKRYCTEFELALGPSDKYQWVEGTEALEAAVFNAIDFDSIGKPCLQPAFMVRHIIRKWIEFAWDRGDSTAIMFNDNQPLFPPVVTYHKPDIGGILK
jgi:hypothetical protein